MSFILFSGLILDVFFSTISIEVLLSCNFFFHHLFLTFEFETMKSCKFDIYYIPSDIVENCCKFIIDLYLEITLYIMRPRQRVPPLPYAQILSRCRVPRFRHHNKQLTHLCRPVRSTFAVRETASLGIMGAPRVPPLNPSESIVL